MCLVLVVGLLLLVMLAGYLVLLRAYAQDGKLKTIGQIVSWVVIVTAFIGIVCSTVAIHSHSRKTYYHKKRFCDYKAKRDIY